MQRTNSQQPLDMISLHPYEYLTELNNIYTSCNKANAKSYSSVSKLKLAWKPFSLMKIPNCFELTYQKQHNNQKQNKNQNKQTMEDSQKKIWKEHQQILKRYSNAKRKQKIGQSYRPQSSIGTGIRFLNNTQNGNASSNNSILIKKMKEKGVNIDSHFKEQVKRQVLSKLKKIQIQGNKNNAWRAQSANCNTKNKKDNQINKINQQCTKQRGKYYFNDRPYTSKVRKNVDENQYLLYQKSSDIIENYKAKIKQVDCAISDKNVKKTAEILRNMENVIDNID